MKSVNWVLLVCLFSAVLVSIYLGLQRNVFEAERFKIASILVKDKDYKVDVFYIPSNASNQDFIQLRLLPVDTVLQNIARYNSLKCFKINGDSLMLTLNDSPLQEHIIDTVKVRLP